jgi:DNA-binding SARP family transcriptional activator
MSADSAPQWVPREVPRPPASARCRITLLGQLTMRQDGRTLTHFRTHKTAALLAYLAYYWQRRHPRTVLVDLLWRDVQLNAGRHSLSTALSFLRHEIEALGLSPGQVIAADSFSVGLNAAAISTDVRDFENSLAAARSAATRRERVGHLRSAVELYGGDLLPGFHEEWVPSESVRLCEEFISAVVQLAALLLEDGDHAAIIALARRAIQADPLREEPYRELMQAYAAMGEPQAALRAYRELAKTLRQELDGRPCLRTRHLVWQLAQLVTGDAPWRRAERVAVVAGLSSRPVPIRARPAAAPAAAAHAAALSGLPAPAA